MSYFLESERLYFREVRESDINEQYYSWMNDSEINEFMETWFWPHSMDNIYDYWVDHQEKRDEPWFAICLKETHEHIGNIKLGKIDWIHRYAEVGFYIGRKDLWGQGYGSEAIKLISDYGLYKLNLHKIGAGIYSENYVSKKAFEKAGFIPDGQRSRHVNHNGKYMDIRYFGKFRE